jgi:hypothetical protein
VLVEPREDAKLLLSPDSGGGALLLPPPLLIESSIRGMLRFETAF